jgi:hypothetical protein
MNTTDKLLALLPSRWFSDSAKAPGGILYAILNSFAAGLDYISDGMVYVRLQTRILTATDTNLDNIATDFFGTSLVRRSGESDGSFRNRIIYSLFPEKATRRGVKKAVENLGATVVEIYEPNYDGFFTDFCCTDGNRISDPGPYEAILFVNRPLNTSNGNLLFTDFNFTDYNYIPSGDTNIWTILDSDVFSAVESSKAAGTRVWVVLDPISITQTTGSNLTSIERYYIPPITLPAPPVFTLDSSLLDGTDVLV